MKKTISSIVLVLVLFTTTAFSQNKLNEYKVGHTFKISLPEYMSKTSGLNTSAAIQYKSSVKDVYGFAISDTKEDLLLSEMKFSSINEFYESFIVTFLKDEEKRTVSASKSKKIGETNFIESDASYFDKEAKIEIFYLVGIVETKTSFYKVISWSTLDNKDKFKADFQKILYSLKD